MNQLGEKYSAVSRDWPELDAIALGKSHELAEIIVQEINKNSGQISFERFMGMALYEPGLGYYSAGAIKFGANGDFTTAPETSSLFSACLARQCEQIFELTGFNTILELGAGSGVMASDIIADLDRRDNLPNEYLILETSADLRDRQQKRLKKNHPDYFDRIQWLDTLPKSSISGIVLANEVLDAMPINRIKVIQDDVLELMVGYEAGQFIWQTGPATEHLADKVRVQLSDLPEKLPNGYVTEISSVMLPFLHSISDVISSGVILLIDYGYPKYEYYHPQRTQGTLVCHYRHRSHNDPFIFIGNQDITAFIDFTNVADCGHKVGFNVNGYTTQAEFLISIGLQGVMQEYRDQTNGLFLSQQAGQLLLPGQMGEKFKVMALTQNIDVMLDGFKMKNAIHRL